MTHPTIGILAGMGPRSTGPFLDLVVTACQFGAVLREAGLEHSHLVKVVTFLTDRSQAEANSEIRREILGAHEPALTVIVAQTLDPRWLLEIEAIAAFPDTP